ncbi:MAG: hybrid sensor histidine kinase/response regulator [Bacilli bacterium]
MTLEFELPLVSLIFIIILCIIYFSKKRVNLTENKPYEVILVCSLIEALIDTIIHFICSFNSFDIIVSNYFTLFNILNKVLSCLFVIIFSSLFCYTMMITYNKVKEKPKKLVSILVIINVLFAIVMLFTNIELVDVGLVTNVTGLTTILGYVMVAIMLLASLVIAIINIKKIDKRYLPIFLIFFILAFLFLFTLLIPGMIIYDLVLALMCYIMYFTIENPDVKMLDEVHLAKEISDNANEEKTMFLYNMTNEIRDITRQIDKSADDILDEIDNNKINVAYVENSARDIKVSTAKFTTMTNEILDISSVDAANIKIYNDKYNIKLVLKQLIMIYKGKCENKSIIFRSNIASDLPDYLYGDSVGIKNVLSTILDNAVNYTDKGYVEFNVNTIRKQDICRLLITIEDSGIGIKAYEIDKIFNKTEDDKKKNLGNDLYTARKIITLMGGAIIPSSTYGKGTVMKVVIDQKIAAKEENDYDKIYHKKKILLVDDSEASEKIIRKLLASTNIEMERVSLGKECLDRIRNKEKYDLILIDDDIKPIDGYTLMKKLKEIRTFKTNVILLSKDNSIQYNDDYLNIGFSDYLIKPIDKNLLLEKMDKYL